MECLHRGYGVTHFWMSDDLYVSRGRVSREHALSIAEELIRRRLRVTYRILARADSFVHADGLLQTLRRSGLTTVFLGLESGSDEMLKEFNKRTTVDANRSAVCQLREEGITLQIGFIMFSPYSRLGDLAINGNFLREIGEFYRLFPATRAMDVFPGTHEVQRLQQLGLL